MLSQLLFCSQSSGVYSSVLWTYRVNEKNADAAQLPSGALRLFQRRTFVEKSHARYAYKLERI